MDQFELAEDVTRALGVVTWPMVEFEADDALGTAAARFAREDAVQQVVIASPDKDLTQCVEGERVVCWDRRRQIVLDESGVKEKFGVLPESIPDYLALVGDAADGIPGIFGWGKKSSAALLDRYRHIESIPDNAADWEVKPRRAYDLAANLRHERDEALLYRKLATLRIDVSLEEDLAALEWRGADRETDRGSSRSARRRGPDRTRAAISRLRVRARINAHSWASRRPYGKAREVNNI